MTFDYAFTDGSPLYELAAFVTLFLACFVASYHPGVRRAIDRGILSLAGFVRRRGVFATPGPEAEQRRIDVMRVVLGAMAMWSMGRDLASVAVSGDATQVGLQAGAFGLAVMIFAGLAAPVAALVFTVILNPLVGNLTYGSNLDQMVLAIGTMALAFAPAGRTLSVDSLLVRLPGPFGSPWRGIYRLWGPLTVERSIGARFAAFVAYAAITMSSSAYHVEDEAWRLGVLNAWNLLSPLSNPHYHQAVEWVYREWPAGYVAWSRVTTYGMLAWQITLLPLILLHQWTRRLAVAWGFAFFAVTAFILPLRALGWHELAVWTLIFGHRWMRPGGGVGCPSAVPRPAEVPAAQASAGLTALYRAFAASLAILLVAFLVRLPHVRDLPGLDVVAEASRTVFGQAPLAYGIGPVDVFNNSSVMSMRRPLEGWWSLNGVEVAHLTRDYYAFISDPDLFITERYHRTIGLTRDYCGDQFVHDYYARTYAHWVDVPSAAGRLLFHADFKFISTPTADDLLAHRYVPTTVALICRITLDARTLEPISTVFTEDAARLYSQVHALPFTPRPESIPLLREFPCARELDRLSWWLDRPDLLERRADARQAFDRMLAGIRHASPITCFGEVERMQDVLALDWRASNPPPSAPCGPDLELAAAYYDDVFDDSLRAKALPLLNGATIAEARKDQIGCLLAAAAVRRTYHAALGDPTPFEPVTSAAPAPRFRVHPEQVPVLDRFPCEAEASRLAWWDARLDLDRDAEGRAAVARMVHEASVKDPIVCFDEAQAAVDALGLDWRPENPPPAASCEADLVLAAAYYDEAFDDRLRATTLPLLNGAVVAAARNDPAACLLAAAAVRRTYLAAAGIPGAPGAEAAAAPPGPAAAAAPFRIRPEAVPLLDRFPCAAEAQRLAWWVDRPDLLASTPTTDGPVARALREAAVKDPIDCLLDVQAAADALSLDWSRANPPPLAPCDPDVALATVYFDRVFDEPLRDRARADLGRMVQAVQQQDHVSCLLAAASIRRTYVDAVGAAALTR